MIKQTIHLIGVIYKEFLRNPGIIFWAILFPVMMAWGLGLAFTNQEQLIKNAAWITSKDSVLGEVRDNQILLGNKDVGFTTYRLIESTKEEALTLMKQGKISIILDESSGSMAYQFDPKNPDSQLAYYQFTTYLSGYTSSDEIQLVQATGSRYVDFLVPGLVAMNIMMSCMWGISFNLIDKRIRKLLRRMVATPMKKSAFLTAQFIARIGLSGMEVAIILLFTWAYFGIKIQGSILAFLVLFIAGNAAFTGIAILVSSRTSNTQIGNGLINMVVMPMMILSGIFFSYHGFPDWMIAVIKWLPLTILADSIRSVFNEGASLVQVLPAIGVLTGVGAVFYLVGVRIYKWY